MELKGIVSVVRLALMLGEKVGIGSKSEAEANVGDVMVDVDLSCEKNWLQR